MTIWDRGTYEAEKFRDDEVDRQLRRRAGAGPLRALPDRRRQLDDPPHGPADRPEREPMPGADRADAGDAVEAAARRRGLGRSRSSGTGCGRSPTARRAIYGCESRNLRDITAQYPELRRDRAPARRPARPSSTARSSPSTRTAARLPAPPAAHAPRLRRGGAPAHRRPPGHLRGLRPAATSTAARCSTRPYTRAARAARRRSGSTGRPGRRPPTTAATAGAAAADRRPRARGRGREAPRQPLPAGPARARLAEGQEHRAARSSSSAAGSRAGRPPATLGALLVGYYDDGELRYAGRVGTGFTDATLRRLRRAASSRCATGESPFTGRQPPASRASPSRGWSPRSSSREWTQNYQPFALNRFDRVRDRASGFDVRRGRSAGCRRADPTRTEGEQRAGSRGRGGTARRRPRRPRRVSRTACSSRAPARRTPGAATGHGALHRLDDRRQDVRQLGRSAASRRRSRSTASSPAGPRACSSWSSARRRRFWIPEELAYKGRAGRAGGHAGVRRRAARHRQAPPKAPPDVAAPPKDAKKTASGLAYKVLKPGHRQDAPEGDDTK